MTIKSLLTLVAFGIGTIVQAQVGPGLFAGGSIGVTTGKSKFESGSVSIDGPKTTAITFAPSLGYYFTEQIGAGVRFAFSQQSAKEDVGNTEEKETLTGIGAELFARYAAPIGGSDNFAFLTELNFGFASIKGKFESGSTTFDTNPITGFNVGIEPGVMFFPSPKYGFEASLGNIFGFSSMTEKDADDDSIKETFTDINILNLSTMSLDFGFYYYFNR